MFNLTNPAWGIENNVHLKSWVRVFDDTGRVLVPDDQFKDMTGRYAGALGFSLAKKEFSFPEDARLPVPAMSSCQELADMAAARAVAAIYRHGRSSASGNLRYSGGQYDHYHGVILSANGVPCTNENQVKTSIRRSFVQGLSGFLTSPDVEKRHSFSCNGHAVMGSDLSEEEKDSFRTVAVRAVEECVAEVNDNGGDAFSIMVAVNPSWSSFCRRIGQDGQADYFEYDVIVEVTVSVTYQHTWRRLHALEVNFPKLVELVKRSPSQHRQCIVFTGPAGCGGEMLAKHLASQIPKGLFRHGEGTAHIVRAMNEPNGSDRQNVFFITDIGPSSGVKEVIERAHIVVHCFINGSFCLLKSRQTSPEDFNASLETP